MKNSSHRRSSRVTMIISIIVSVLIVFSGMFFTLTFVLNSAVFSIDHMLSIMNKKGFYVIAYDELRSEMKSVGDASGIDETFFDRVLTADRVKSDVKKVVENLYHGGSVDDRISNFRSDVFSEVKKYAQEKGTVITEDKEKALKTVTDEITKKYSSFLKSFDFISEYTQKACDISMKSAWILGVATLVLIAVLFLLNRWKHRTVRYCIYSFSSIAIILIIFASIVEISGIIDRINLSSQSFYTISTGCMHEVTTYIFLAAGTIIVFTLLLMGIYVALRKKAKK